MTPRRTLNASVFSISLATAVVAYAAIAAAEDASPVFATQNFMATLRGDVGKPLLSTFVALVNETHLNPEAISSAGASFFFGSEKTPGMNVDALRRASSFIVALTTCPGATVADARVSGATVWETVQTDSARSSIALGLQQILASITNPPSIQNPGSMRAPHLAEFHGVVFDYQKGDTHEQVSLLNEDGADPSDKLKIEWSVANTAVCPKP